MHVGVYIYLSMCRHWRILYVCICIISLVGRVFANGLAELGSIPGCIIPKNLKMLLDTSLLNTQQYKVHIKWVKWSNPGKGVASSPTHRCSSYWKGSFPVALDYGRQLNMYVGAGITVLECTSIELAQMYKWEWVYLSDYAYA